MNEQSPNAFSMLMASARKNHNKRESQSNFIPCPTCNKSFSYAIIDLHVEKCCSSSNNYSNQGNLENGDSYTDVPVVDDVEKVHDNVETVLGSKRKRDILGDQDSEQPDPTALEEDHAIRSVATKLSTEEEEEVSSPPCRKNAFKELLQSSRKLFQEEEMTRHHFCLSEDNGDFSLRWICQESEVPRLSEVKWSETVILHTSEEETKQGINKILLVLETSIPSEQPFHLPVYVQKHSKLSVPVLKSVLQKSIRRRRPMPSVRIAMELVDKAFSELLRRLPIIILEDAFLHNDFPFLVWLMAAESKNYVPPKKLIDKVLQIVFEVASCPWKDDCHESQGKGDMLHNPKETASFRDDPDQCNLMLHSMSMRKKYGGMTCDKIMIDNFIALWTERYRMRHVEPSIAKIIYPSSSTDNPILWKDVPFLLYRQTVQSSSNLLLTLQKSPLPMLTKHDICPSGIDFHCSNVLNVLLRPECPFYIKLQSMFKDSTDVDLENMAKKIMWDYSSGVNNRRNISTGKLCTKLEGDDAIKMIWDDFAYPLVQRFADNYIDARLASW